MKRILFILILLPVILCAFRTNNPEFDVTDPVEAQGLIYDSATLKWINGAGGVDTDSLYVDKLVVDAAVVVDTNGTAFSKGVTGLSHINTLAGAETMVANTNAGASVITTVIGGYIAIDTTNVMLKWKGLSDGAGGIIAGSLEIIGVTAAKYPSTLVNTATYTVLASDSFLDVTYTSTGACTITIPSALIDENFNIEINDGGFLAGTNNITVHTEGAETIQGSTADFIINSNEDSFGIKGDGAGTGLLTY
jgi:hypothetical protein